MKKIVNKKAQHDYEVLAKYEAGIVLAGSEVKSVRKGAVSLKGSRVILKDGEMWVVGMQINPYEFADEPEYDPIRSRKLLLRRQEISSLAGKMQQKGLTVVPLACYNSGGLIKVELGLVRGKKQYEKREELKKREAKKEAARVAKLKKIN